MKQKKKTKSVGKFVGFLLLFLIIVGGVAAISSSFKVDSNPNPNPPIINNNDSPTAIYTTDQPIVF